MLLVKDQREENIYRICYYHLKHDKILNIYHMIGYDERSKRLINLGTYNFYRQAITVFAQMDWLENDLFYYKNQNRGYLMPPNITDEQECIAIYGRTF